MSTGVAWFVLFIAGLCEVGWAVGMKYTDGFSRLWPSVWTVIGMIASVVLLGIAMKSLPLGTSYMVWTGIGAVGSFILGIVLLGESATLPRVAAAALIVVGLVVLKLTSTE